MPNLRTFTLSSKKNHLEIKITKGHFATSHSHTNYYIDVITQKTNLKAAKATAEELLTYFKSTLEIDTILCLDNMEVVGTFISSMLTSREFININSGK
ncbi:MAG: orotate phosphoribosyltransferase, partial [Clostridia bacterium]|nr:orotate phosphoribosyltransferase [Clostridia bacterium]